MLMLRQAPHRVFQTYVLPGGMFFEIHGGCIARAINYCNPLDWIGQVRVSS